MKTQINSCVQLSHSLIPTHTKFFWMMINLFSCETKMNVWDSVRLFSMYESVYANSYERICVLICKTNKDC